MSIQLMNELNVQVDRLTSLMPASTDRLVRVSSTIDETDGALEEEMIQLVRRVFLSADKDTPRQVLFCGVEGDRDDSLVCARAARILATRSSLSVCLVDANLRSPRLRDFFRIDTATPFTGPVDSLREQCVGVTGNLWLGGPEILANDNRELLPAEDLKKRLAELRSMFGHVLIDVAATNVKGDVQLLGQLSDAAILVIEANRTRRQAARNTKEFLAAAGVRLLGAVLHNRSFPIPEKLYKRL